MIYFDTAYVLKCYAPERGSGAVRDLLKSEPVVGCSSFGRVELMTALLRTVREGRLDQRVLDTVLGIMDDDELNGVWIWLPITQSILDATLATLKRLPPAIPIRAGDALHLQCAKSHGIKTIYSNDRHLIAAAPHFGLQAQDVIGSVPSAP
ncbi:MAG: type II toxin-antitoxin system VapC family toxin [Planctomycetaceae bacterium]|nr:type II toxin-antitoxin system VapC family toxin [Planctomycetaceae bacterium]